MQVGPAPESNEGAQGRKEALFGLQYMGIFGASLVVGLVLMPLFLLDFPIAIKHYIKFLSFSPPPNHLPLFSQTTLEVVGIGLFSLIALPGLVNAMVALKRSKTWRVRGIALASLGLALPAGFIWLGFWTFATISFYAVAYPPLTT